MSAASTSTALSQIELSVRIRQEGDTDLARIVEDTDDILTASRLADSTVPDGGYGWVVIGGCGLITFWFVDFKLNSVGTSYCWGVLQAALVSRSVSSASTLSFVGSLWTTFIALLALVNARVIRALGAQKTGLLGIGLLGLGEVASSFSTKSVGGLFVTTGVVMGIGTRWGLTGLLVYSVVSVTPAQYFSRRRGLANGIVYASGGLGGTVISFAMDGLISRLGPAWTFRIIGFMTLATGLPAAWLIKERAPIKSTAFIDFALLKDAHFIVIFLGGAIATFPILVPPFFLPLYASSLHLAPSAGAGLVAGFNFSSAVGRLFSGLLCDLIGPLNSLFLALVTSAVSMLVLWPVSTSLGPLIAFVAINGAANGGFFATMPTVVGSVFGSARVSVAMGMIVSGWAGGYLLGAPIAGFMLSAYGGEEGGIEAYRPAIIYAGSTALAASGMVAYARLRYSKVLLKKL